VAVENLTIDLSEAKEAKDRTFAIVVRGGDSFALRSCRMRGPRFAKALVGVSLVNCRGALVSGNSFLDVRAGVWATGRESSDMVVAGNTFEAPPIFHGDRWGPFAIFAWDLTKQPNTRCSGNTITGYQSGILAGGEITRNRISLSARVVDPIRPPFDWLEPVELCVGEECYRWYFAVYSGRPRGIVSQNSITLSTPLSGGVVALGAESCVRANRIVGAYAVDTPDFQRPLGVLVTSGTSVSTDDVVVADNRFDGPLHGVIANGHHNRVGMRRLLVQGNVCGPAHGWAHGVGVGLYETSDAAVSGNYIRGKAAGVHVLAAAWPFPGTSQLLLSGGVIEECKAGVLVLRGGSLDVSDVTVRQSWSVGIMAIVAECATVSRCRTLSCGFKSEGLFAGGIWLFAGSGKRAEGSGSMRPRCGTREWPGRPRRASLATA
jgi:hypothetical protein